MIKSNKKLASAALAGLFATTVLVAGNSFAAEEAKSSCKGKEKTEKAGCKGVEAKEKHSCKGKSSCKGTDEAKEKHACKGKNSCKGQGSDGKNACKGKGSCKTESKE